MSGKKKRYQNRSHTSDKKGYLKKEVRKHHKDLNSQRKPQTFAKPEGLRRKSLLSSSPQYIENEVSTRSPFPSSFSNTTPLFKSEICENRKERKEVLFAKGFAGKGKVKKANWNEKSYVRCS